MDKWETLFARLEITGGESSYCREEDFIAFEREQKEGVGVEGGKEQEATLRV